MRHSIMESCIRHVSIKKSCLRHEFSILQSCLKFSQPSAIYNLIGDNVTGWKFSGKKSHTSFHKIHLSSVCLSVILANLYRTSGGSSQSHAIDESSIKKLDDAIVGAVQILADILPAGKKKTYIEIK